jgi:PiT family inorganic phosphate transporter
LDHTFLYVGFIILVALAFDFTNGMHDAANSVATIVATRTLSPRQAVLWAAMWNFVAFFFFGHKVANTVGKGMVDIHAVTETVILAGLAGAIAWNLITLTLGLPTSSSHALLGGYAGATVAHAGFGAIIWSGWSKTLIFLVLAPAIGLVVGSLLRLVSLWIIYLTNAAPARVTRVARSLQICSAAAYSLGHGGNDSQKTMGIIASLLVSAKIIDHFYIPVWVALSAYTAIGLGTWMGGWKIMKTMGSGIAKLWPADAVCADIASASSIFTATAMGVPVSTTHVVTGAISGVGAAKRRSAVRWHITMRIVWAWVLTIPGAAIVAWLCEWLLGSVGRLS